VSPFSFMSTVSLNHSRVNESGTRLLHNIRDTQRGHRVFPSRFRMDYPRTELDELMPVVYDELRGLAQKYLSHERANHTLQTTALVHEAYLRLVDQKAVDWQNRAQFFGIAASMMRRILINYANDRHAKKRQGYATRISLDEAVNFFEKAELDLTTLDEALNELARLDSQQARIVELRFFGGLTIDEVSEVLEISPATTKREWDSAKLWLRRQLGTRR